MKVYIGPYPNWIGPYQLAQILLFFIPKVKNEHGLSDHHPIVDKFGDWLAKNSDGSDSRLSKFLNWVHSKKNRTVIVKTDRYDCFSADVTLSLIATPLLKDLQETKMGSPGTDDEDVPEHLRSTAAPEKENEWDTDANWHLRWEWILGEIVWAMSEIAAGKPGEDQFYDHGEVDNSESISRQISKIKIDKEGLTAYNDRLQNGCRLFGKYFQALWS